MVLPQSYLILLLSDIMQHEEVWPSGCPVESNKLVLYTDDIVLIGSDEPQGTINADVFVRHICYRG